MQDKDSLVKHLHQFYVDFLGEVVDGSIVFCNNPVPCQCSPVLWKPKLIFCLWLENKLYIASCLVFITQSVCAPSVFSGQNLSGQLNWSRIKLNWIEFFETFKTFWRLHDTIRQTNEETTRDDYKLKCKIKIEDYAKDVEVEDGDNDEDENYTTLHYTVVEDGDNDEDENYTGEILSL